jgi:hypothetical protein
MDFKRDGGKPSGSSSPFSFSRIHYPPCVAGTLRSQSPDMPSTYFLIVKTELCTQRSLTPLAMG